MKQIRTRLLNGFEDGSFGSAEWSELLRHGETHGVNMTWEWQRNWWEAFGRGRLLLTVAERNGEPVAAAPLFSEGGMIFNLCPEDWLDFVGDVSDPDVLDALLKTAIEAVPNFAGICLYFIPDSSGTGSRLQEAAARLGLTCVDQGQIPCPALDLDARPEAIAAARKSRLLRSERFFRRGGEIEVLHLREPDAILPHLDEFFDQHVERRAATPHPSLFLDPKQRAYYRRVTEAIGPTGWLRFTRVVWRGRAIAHHYGLSFRGRYLFGIPSFAIDLSQHGPGNVLLRQLLLAAIDEGATSFDFGIGDEPYKYEYANRVAMLRTWGLYPVDGRSE